MVETKIFLFMGFFAISLLLVVFAISLPVATVGSLVKIVLLLVALILDMAAYASRYYSYLILPVLKQRTRRIVLSNEDAYWLSTTGDSIIHKEGEEFIASVYIKIPLYRSATEMTIEEKLEFTKQISRLVSLSNNPVRFTTQLHIMNKDDYLATLRSAIGSAVTEQAEMLNRTVSESESERIKGKSSMWQHMLDNVSESVSLEQLSYATVSAKGSKEFEAVSMAQQRAREVMSGISAILGVSPSVITGNLILRFVEPEYLIPYSTVSEQITKSMREEVV